MSHKNDDRTLDSHELLMEQQLQLKKKGRILYNDLLLCQSALKTTAMQSVLLLFGLIFIKEVLNIESFDRPRQRINSKAPLFFNLARDTRLQEECRSVIKLEETVVAYSKVQRCEPQVREQCGRLQKTVFHRKLVTECDIKWSTICHIGKRKKLVEKTVEFCIDESHCEELFVSYILKVPVETCQITPYKACNPVPKIFPKLVEEYSCINITKDSCYETILEHKKRKPAIKEYCL